MVKSTEISQQAIEWIVNLKNEVIANVTSGSMPFEKLIEGDEGDLEYDIVQIDENDHTPFNASVAARWDEFVIFLEDQEIDMSILYGDYGETCLKFRKIV